MSQLKFMGNLPLGGSKQSIVLMLMIMVEEGGLCLQNGV